MADEQKITLEQELEACKKQAEEYLNGWKRAKADYLNREREVEKEKAQWMDLAALNTVLTLLPVVESFDKAFAQLAALRGGSAGLDAPPEETGDKLSRYGIPPEIEQWIQGIVHTRDELWKALKNLKVEKIETTGKKFDTAFMESVGKEKVKDKEPGMVVKEAAAGYIMAGQVIKPAQVIVAE